MDKLQILTNTIKLITKLLTKLKFKRLLEIIFKIRSYNFGFCFSQWRSLDTFEECGCHIWYWSSTVVLSHTSELNFELWIFIRPKWFITISDHSTSFTLSKVMSYVNTSLDANVGSSVQCCNSHWQKVSSQEAVNTSFT